MTMKWKECSPDEVKVSRLIWSQGTPHDPAGYYVNLEFRGASIQAFLAYADEPTGDDDE